MDDQLPTLKSVDLAELLHSKAVVDQQKTDPSLAKLREHAQRKHVHSLNSTSTEFVWRNDRLYRKITYAKGAVKLQFVVPGAYRQQVFRLGHSSILGGHLGAAKTLERIQAVLFWPGMGEEIKRLARSCDICQRTTDRGRNPNAPLQPLPVIEEPFARVAVDIVGPIVPAAADKSRYILSIVDFATRWPEAVPLKNIEAVTVAEAMFQVFCRVGIPREVLSDRGSQFTSSLMTDTLKLLAVKGMQTTPYHPQGNGLCEKWNGTLKKMLKRMAADQPQEWPRYIAPLLFAYREAPQSSLRFSPFELVYGRCVRGPLHVLRELWDGDNQDPAITSSYQYVLDLNERLRTTCELAKEELLKAQAVQKKFFDRKARKRTLQAGDQCLVLLPTSTNKLLAQWKGPYPVLEKLSNVNYMVGMGHAGKRFHVNMLKRYHVAASVAPGSPDPSGEGSSPCHQQGGTLLQQQPDEEEDGVETVCTVTIIPDDRGFSQPITPVLQAREGPGDVAINPKLADQEQIRLQQVIEEFATVFSDLPRVAKVDEHKISLTDKSPVRTKPYPIPLKYVDSVIEEVKSMEQAGIIEKSSSPYCSPIVVVGKKEGGIRICGDYRKVNAITHFDAEPMPDQRMIFSRLATSKHFTKLDLTKGFFQIPLHPTSRKITAFRTPCGLFQYTVLPFGLTNSPAVFNRCMRKVLGDIPGVEVFVDDVLIHTVTLEEHIHLLRLVLGRLEQHNMTAKPSKCNVAFGRIKFLGHMIGEGRCECQEEKIVKIRQAPRPMTQKQVRSFLGMTGYYRSFVKDYNTVALPLYDLLKKGCNSQVSWGATQEAAFLTLKEALCSQPILRLPDKDRPFILRTDASEEGVGAVLLQDFDGAPYPVAYHSRRLSQAERNYSVVERELLAVVEGVHKFYYNLCGGRFLLETDHMPLAQVKHTKTTNARLMRWALYLQQFDFSIKYIRGDANVGADLLSRLMNGDAEEPDQGPRGSCMGDG